MGLKYLILVISLGKRNNIIKYTSKLLEDYSKKINIELKIINNYDNFKKSKCHILFSKTEIINYYLDLYDRIIYLDDTCIVSPNTPNLFDLVPENKLGAYIESNDFFRKEGGGLGNWGVESIKNAYNYYSKQEHNNNLTYSPDFVMINTGVMVLSKCHKYLFNTDNYTLDFLSFGDQCFISYQINKNNSELFDIGTKYNTVGSVLLQNRRKLHKLINTDKHMIFHVTKGSGNYRENILKKLFSLLHP